MSLAESHILLVGDSIRIKEMSAVLLRFGRPVVLASDVEKALELAEVSPPAGIVFVLPTYWESVGDFVGRIRANKILKGTPIFYLGDFIESNDQLILKRQGVFTMTLGPVPLEEAARFILEKIKNYNYDLERLFQNSG